MTIALTNCPECDVRVVKTDNNVALSYPAEPFDSDIGGACWGIMTIGPLDLAAVGGEHPDGLGHRLHEHQPWEGS